MKVSLIQMPVTDDRRRNMATAAERIRAAAAGDGGVDMAVLPEMYLCPYDTKRFAAYAEKTCGGDSCTVMSALARELGIFIVAGSIPELDGDRLYNTSFVFGPDGHEVARHRKIHLFDIDVDGGQRFRESDVLSPGTSDTVFDTPWGPVGLCICFDIRFQELALLMALRGARVIVVPGAFNMTTGPAHWELHFRARAVDNQLFTIGVAPARDATAGYVSWGHSIVCDPWGRVLHDSGPGDADATVDVDLSMVESIRRQLPIHSARRPEIVGRAAREAARRP